MVDKGLIPVGAAAPTCSPRDQHGAIQRLSDQRGRAVVVYFYPKDGTPGAAPRRRARSATRGIGSSRPTCRSSACLPTPASRLTKFATENKLPFPILVDTDHAWATAFGVPMRLGATARVTFLVDPDGKIAKVYPDVDRGARGRGAEGRRAAHGRRAPGRAGGVEAAQRRPERTPRRLPPPGRRPAAAPAGAAEPATAAPVATGTMLPPAAPRRPRRKVRRRGGDARARARARAGAPAGRALTAQAARRS